jgi:hypothetical protein
MSASTTTTMTPAELVVHMHAGNDVDLSAFGVGQLAELTFEDWRLAGGPWRTRHYAALPYADAMVCMESIDDAFGLDDGRGIVLRFLSNAANWRGAVARAIKAELRKRVGR